VLGVPSSNLGAPTNQNNCLYQARGHRRRNAAAGTIQIPTRAQEREDIIYNAYYEMRHPEERIG
jgi:hypothetical protein